MIETITQAVKEKIHWTNTDFFKRMQQVILAKGQVTLKDSYIYDFATIVMELKSIEEVRKQAEKVSPDLVSMAFTYNINFLKFKEGN